MATIAEALTLARGHHQAGRLQTAEQIYRQILAVEPRQPEAWQLLGVVMHQLGRHELAVEHLEQSLRLRNDQATWHSNLGEAYRALRRFPDAIACYQRALHLQPDLAGVHYNLGNVFKAQGRLTEAVACYQRALHLQPTYVEAHNNLGNTFRELKQLSEAITHYRLALQAQPNGVDALNNLGNALKDQGQPAEAVACFRRALQLNPNHVPAHCNLGTALLELGQHDEARACYQRALQLKPDFAEAYYNLGFAAQDQGEYTEAVRCYQRALQLQPDYAEAYNNLGVAWRDQGEVEEALACFQRARQLDPQHTATHSNFVFTLHYRAGVTPHELAAAHQEFERQHAQVLRDSWKPHSNDRDPERPLRLGFVSPDLRRHPVGYFFVRVLEHLDPQQCATICYYNRRIEDELTARLRAAATTWREVADLNDDQLAEQIRMDQVDILFDLAGHTARNRLLVFARKPAPVQITWIGYEGTTGLTAMDYLLADRQVVPEGTETHHGEKILRLPDGYLIYDPPAAAPPVGPLPALSRGYVTFGCCNNLAKITAPVIAAWAQILRRVPRSRLVLQYKGLGDETVRRRYRERFVGRGVEPERVELLPPTSYAQYLESLQQLDLVLDPFPFSGSTTTCEALWMGVPVVTCPGATFASRHSASHLASIGLTELIAGSLDAYVELAAALAGDLPRLAALRAGLRQRMAAAPLCDGPRCAGNLLALLRAVWRESCQRSAY